MPFEWLEGALKYFSVLTEGKGEVHISILLMAKEIKASNLTVRKSFMFLTAHNSCLWARTRWTLLPKKLRVK